MTLTKIRLLVSDARNAGRFTVLAVYHLSVVVQMVVSSFTQTVQILNIILLPTMYVFLTNVEVVLHKNNFEFKLGPSFLAIKICDLILEAIQIHLLLVNRTFVYHRKSYSLYFCGYESSVN